MNAHTGIGASLLRKEDRRFITGKGNYVADIKRPGHGDGRVSPFAARACDHQGHRHQGGCRDARRCRDLTGADLAADKVGGLPCAWGVSNADGTPMKEPPRSAMAVDKARCVGDAVAFVVADTLEQAREAAEAIEIDYEVLPAVVGVLDAIRPGAAAVLTRFPNNTCFDWECGDAKATGCGVPQRGAYCQDQPGGITAWSAIRWSRAPRWRSTIPAAITTRCGRPASFRMWSRC